MRVCSFCLKAGGEETRLAAWHDWHYPCMEDPHYGSGHPLKAFSQLRDFPCTSCQAALLGTDEFLKISTYFSNMNISFSLVLSSDIHEITCNHPR